MVNPTLVLLAFVSATMIYSVNLWFSLSGAYVAIATIIFAGALVYIGKKLSVSRDLNYEGLLAAVLFIFTLLSFTLNVVDINAHLSLAMWVNRGAMFLASFLALTYIIDTPKGKVCHKLWQWKFPLLVTVALVIQFTQLRVVKDPVIDIYDVVKYGPLQLLSGKNPYETPKTVPNLPGEFRYPHYAYGPVSIYLFFPVNVILGDPRYLLVLANIATAFSLYTIAKESGQKPKVYELLPLLFLFHPRLIYFVTYSHTDLAIVGLLSLGFLSLVKNHLRRFGIFLALVLGIKIPYLFPLLFVLKYQNLRRLNWVIFALITILVTHLPFVLWNWQAMWTSIVSLNVGYDKAPLAQEWTLTFAAFIKRQFLFFPPQIVHTIFLAFWVIVFWLTIKPVKNAANMLLILALVFITTVFFGPIGMPNYYFSASIFLLFTLAFSPASSSSKRNFSRSN